MYTFFTIILPALVGLTLAYLLARMGRKKYIGFKWAFYWGLVSPLFGGLVIILSRRITRPAPQRNVLVIPFAIIIALYGLIMFLSGTNTNNNTKIDNGNRYSKEIENIDFTSKNTIFIDAGSNIGRVLVSGLFSLTVNIHVYKLMDYRQKRFTYIHTGLLLIFWASYMLRKRREIPIIREKSINTSHRIEDEISFKQETSVSSILNKLSWVENPSSASSSKSNLYKLRDFIFSEKLRYYRYTFYSGFVGFISGSYFKKPVPELYEFLVQQSNSGGARWKNELIIDYYKSYGFFFNEHFNFNWLAFITTSFIVFVSLLYLNEKDFRLYILRKLSFRDENN